jgi:hypothetical protein
MYHLLYEASISPGLGSKSRGMHHCYSEDDLPSPSRTSLLAVLGRQTSEARAASQTSRQEVPIMTSTNEILARTLDARELGATRL